MVLRNSNIVDFCIPVSSFCSERLSNVSALTALSVKFRRPIFTPTKFHRKVAWLIKEMQYVVLEIDMPIKQKASEQSFDQLMKRSNFLSWFKKYLDTCHVDIQKKLTEQEV